DSGRPGRAPARGPDRHPRRPEPRRPDDRQAHPGGCARHQRPPSRRRRHQSERPRRGARSGAVMMNFRKIAAASRGRLILRYFTEDTPEPIHPPAPGSSPGQTLDEAGRKLEEGGRLTAYYTGRDSRATWRPDMPGLVARAMGIDPHKMPRDAE